MLDPVPTELVKPASSYQVYTVAASTGIDVTVSVVLDPSQIVTSALDVTKWFRSYDNIECSHISSTSFGTDFYKTETVCSCYYPIQTCRLEISHCYRCKTGNCSSCSVRVKSEPTPPARTMSVTVPASQLFHPIQLVRPASHLLSM